MQSITGQKIKVDRVIRHYCTYFDSNYTARGLALYHSLLQHSNEAFVFWILCFDDQTFQVLQSLDLPGIRPISLAEFEAGDHALALSKENRSQVEYYWTCTPSLPLHIFRNQPEVDQLTYLDADLYFFSDPTPIFQEFGENDILIIGHRYAPEHAHKAASSGIYNVSMLSFRHNETGLGCLEWWRERCLEWCYAYEEDGKFGDQKYLDDWPYRFQGVHILQHKGANLAPWNQGQYQIQKQRNGIFVDEQPLIFYHFHGLRLFHPLYCIPLNPNYNFEPGLLVMIYHPYFRTLEAAQKQVTTTFPSFPRAYPKISLPQLAHSLLNERWMLTRWAPLAKFLWEMSRVEILRNWRRKFLLHGSSTHSTSNWNAR